MTAIVLMKPIHDSNVPLTQEEVESSRFGENESHLSYGPYDENALELALQLKDQHNLSVIVIVMAAYLPDDFLRIPLAVGADELLIIPQSSWDLSACGVAQHLAEAINSVDSPTIVLAGVQSGDWDSGLVPPSVAAQLRVGYVPNVTDVKWVDNTWKITAKTRNTIRQHETCGLFVGSVISSGQNSLRYPTMQGRLKAKRKPITPINVREISPSLPMRLVWISPEQSDIQWIQGDSDEEKGRRLIQQLRKAGWIS